MTLFAWRTQHILKNWLYSDVMYMHWNALIFKWDRSMHFDKCLHSCNHPIVKVKSISIIPHPQISSGSLTINPVRIWDAIVNGFSFLIFLKILFIFRGEGREKERERNVTVWLLLTCPLLGIWPATQACALIRNRIGDPLVHSPARSIHWATPTRAIF